MKQYIVVAYDISDDKSRNKVCELLSAYGKRVNYSVFECFLKQSDIKRLKEIIERNIKKKEDRVLYYYLCKACVERIERIGTPFEEEKIITTIE